jgi:NitT/TauT family transport system permease protein
MFLANSFRQTDQIPASTAAERTVAAGAGGGGMFWRSGLFAGAAWIIAAAFTYGLSDIDDFDRTGLLAGIELAIACLVAIAVGAGARRPAWLSPAIRRTGPWLVALGGLFTAWELVTAKYPVLPRPFFASPQAILEVFTDDYPRLALSVGHSLWLLLGGYLIGAAIGFVAGVSIGWSRAVGYWAHPVLRLVGPLPATAWLPLAFFAFPSSHSASTFLVALATGFPVTVLTWSGVAGVNKAYYDVARTMGASSRFLVLKVVIFPLLCRPSSSVCSWDWAHRSRCSSWPR